MRALMSAFLLFLLVTSTIQADKPLKIDLNLEENEFGVSFLPMKSGEVAILHLSNGEHYLINSGPITEKKALYSFLDFFNIKEIKGMIVTDELEWHPKMVAALQKDFKIGEIFIGDQWNRLDKISQQFQVRTWKHGDMFEFSNHLVLKVLYEGAVQEEGLDFAIQFFKHRFLWLSSNSVNSENVLLDDTLKDVSVVKIPVFTKAKAMSEKLLKHIDPQTAILYRSKEKMMNSELLESIHETWIDLYLTGQHGLISIKFNQHNYEVITLDHESNSNILEEE